MWCGASAEDDTGSRSEGSGQYGRDIDDVGASRQDEFAFDARGILRGIVDPPQQAAEPSLVDAEPGLERICKDTREGGCERKPEREAGAHGQGVPERPLAREDAVPCAAEPLAQGKPGHIPSMRSMLGHHRCERDYARCQNLEKAETDSEHNERRAEFGDRTPDRDIVAYELACILLEAGRCALDFVSGVYLDDQICLECCSDFGPKLRLDTPEEPRQSTKAQ